MLERIKTLCGYSTAKYDPAILETIEEARAEMIRAGVSISEAMEEEPGPLIRKAIITYGIMNHSTDEKEIDRAERAWTKQLDNLRKSEETMA